MTEATASARGFLSSFEAAIHLQKSRRGLIVILRSGDRRKSWYMGK